MNFRPSKYQQDIFEWFDRPDGSVMVSAVAGSGKTTTLVNGVQRLPMDRRAGSLFAAFNSAIVEELKGRLNGYVTCQTLHSLGYSALRSALDSPNWEVDGKKYQRIIGRPRVPVAGMDPYAFAAAVGKVWQFVQQTLTPLDAESLDAMCLRYGIELPCNIEPIAELLPEVDRRGREECAKGFVSFTDMIWAPLVLNLPIKRHQLVAVDECQDLNAAQHLLLQRAMRDDGVLVGVGDPNQAIYAFAGAMNDSFERLREHFSANVKPLSICYRCPSSVIELAQEIVPEIESAPNAPVGVVDTIEEGQFEEMLEPGDMVLCRTNAPLLKLCFQLISRKVHARVRGRDIGAQLAALARSIGKDLVDFDSFPMAVRSWRDAQILALSAKTDAEFAIQSAKDRAECLLTCFASFQPTTCDALAQKIQSLFSDEHSPVILSTVHKAKGLENPRVFIIRPKLMPLIWKGQQPAQLRQEMNLKYVAITRAQQELYFVKEGRHDELF